MLDMAGGRINRPEMRIRTSRKIVATAVAIGAVGVTAPAGPRRVKSATESGYNRERVSCTSFFSVPPSAFERYAHVGS
jgi:hypothetical protein